MRVDKATMQWRELRMYYLSKFERRAIQRYNYPCALWGSLHDSSTPNNFVKLYHSWLALFWLGCPIPIATGLLMIHVLKVRNNLSIYGFNKWQHIFVIKVSELFAGLPSLDQERIWIKTLMCWTLTRNEQPRGALWRQTIDQAHHQTYASSRAVSQSGGVLDTLSQ